MAYQEVKDDDSPKKDDGSIIWEPDNVGDFMEGFYTDKEENVGSFKSNLYHFNSDGQIIKVWGSTLIDNLMKKIEFGTKVMIKYCGKKQGKKNFYKDFKVYEDKEATSDAKSTTPQKEPDSELDSEAMAQIEHYKNTICLLKGSDYEPTYWEIRTLAESDNLPGPDMKRLLKQLADLIERKKLKTGTKPE